MNKLFLAIQLLLINGIRCAAFSSPEECLKALNCKDNDVNCVASCYNVPAPDHNSVIKTADCQNGCLAKYPNNLTTDWANLNQCYIDCIDKHYFNTPAEYISTVNNNNNNVNSQTTTTTNNDDNSTSSTNNTSTNNSDNNNNNINNNNNNNNNNGNVDSTSATNDNTNNNINNTNNANIDSNGTINTDINTNNSNINNTNGEVNSNNDFFNFNGFPNTSVINDVVADSYTTGISYTQTLVNIAIMFTILLAFY